MIQVTQRPFSDPDKATLHEWLNHPGRLLYQRFLASQVAEKMAEAENLRINDEQASDRENSKTPEADLLTTHARVIRAANKAFDQVLTKDYKFYTVELKPETATKTTNP